MIVRITCITLLAMAFGTHTTSRAPAHLSTHAHRHTRPRSHGRYGHCRFVLDGRVLRPFRIQLDGCSLGVLLPVGPFWPRRVGAVLGNEHGRYDSYWMQGLVGYII